jgi:hypothetical protein
MLASWGGYYVLNFMHLERAIDTGPTAGDKLLDAAWFWGSMAVTSGLAWWLYRGPARRCRECRGVIPKDAARCRHCGQPAPIMVSVKQEDLGQDFECPACARTFTARAKK